MSSAAVDASDQYSPSVLDLATISCFLKTKEMQFTPRYMQYLVVERLVSGQPAQSAFEKPDKFEMD